LYTYNLGLKFYQVADTFPDNLALKFPDTGKGITYRELNKKSNQYARFILDSGIHAGDVVCIIGEKVEQVFYWILACLKLGVVYSIFDPASPVERIKKIIHTCNPKILFVDRGFIEPHGDMIWGENILVLDVSDGELNQQLGLLNGENLLETRSVTGSYPAYIMFTSGSTGIPKGAVMSHQNVLNFIEWNIETFGFSSDDVLTNVNPLYFDNSVFDYFSALFSGACLVPFTKEIVTDPKLLLDYIDECQCTSWFSVPSLLMFLQTMRALSGDSMKHIKRIIFGGEGYPKAKLKELYDLYAHRMTLFNVYGPTECTCMCSAYILSEDDFADLVGFPPLGEIADNFDYLILGDNGTKLSENEIGELCLLGPNVGVGYYNDPERTRISFAQNPYNPHFDEIMYKTGDLVLFNPEDGKIHIRGRKDYQIKHMGYRIELEEIENALSCLDYISQSAVLYGNLNGFDRIVGVVCADEGVDEMRIREDLKPIIPDYMIPAKFYFETELPKNPNGKVDRNKLKEKYL